MLYDALPQDVCSVAGVPCADFMVVFYAMMSTTARTATVATVVFVRFDSWQWHSSSVGFNGFGGMVATQVLVALVAMVAASVLQNTFVARRGHTIRFYQLSPCDVLSQTGGFDAVSKSAKASTSKPIRPGNEAG